MFCTTRPLPVLWAEQSSRPVPALTAPPIAPPIALVLAAQKATAVVPGAVLALSFLLAQTRVPLDSPLTISGLVKSVLCLFPALSWHTPCLYKIANPCITADTGV